MPIYDSTAIIGTTTKGKIPNITGDNCSVVANASIQTGVILKTNKSSYVGDKTSSTWKYTDFDASRSSDVYDNNATGITPAGVYVGGYLIKY